MDEKLSPFDFLKIVHLDKDGNVKPVFQENKFFQFLINKGLVSPRFPKIPYLLGRWQNHKEIYGINDSR